MMRYRLWHTWHKQDIVIYANVAWRKTSVMNGLTTNYVYDIAFTLPLSSFSLWHTQNKRVPYVREIKRNRIGVVSGNADLDTNSSPNLYTWPVFHDRLERKGDR